jgi:hypothetical protein
LLWNNPGAGILIVVFLVGAVFFAVGTALVRRERVVHQAPQSPSVPVEVDYFVRIDELLTRGDAASVKELEALRDRNANPEIRDAADAALMVIASRRV